MTYQFKDLIEAASGISFADIEVGGLLNPNYQGGISMTPPRLAERIARIIGPYFPSDPTTETSRSIEIVLDSRIRAAFDPDGLANDFVGTGYYLVTESRGHEGCFSSVQTTYRAKRFSYFSNDAGNVILRDLSPASPLDPTRDLAEAPGTRIAVTRSGQSTRPPTLEEAREWAARRSRRDPISIFVGNIDAREGNEAEFSRGVASLGIVNLLSLFSRP